MFSHDKLEPQENLYYYYYYDTLTSNEFFWASVCALVYYALILMFGLRKTSTILIDDGKNESTLLFIYEQIDVFIFTHSSCVFNVVVYRFNDWYHL